MTNFVYNLNEFQPFDIDGLPLIEGIIVFAGIAARMRIVESKMAHFSYEYQTFLVSEYLNIFIPVAQIGRQIFTNQGLRIEKWRTMKNTLPVQKTAQVISEWAKGDLDKIIGGRTNKVYFNQHGSLCFDRSTIYSPTLSSGWINLKEMDIPYDHLETLRKKVVSSK